MDSDEVRQQFWIYKLEWRPKMTKHWVASQTKQGIAEFAQELKNLVGMYLDRWDQRLPLIMLGWRPLQLMMWLVFKWWTAVSRPFVKYPWWALGSSWIATWKPAKDNQIELIDLVVVNLYPFKETFSNQMWPTLMVENIDIGGPSFVQQRRTTLA